MVLGASNPKTILRTVRIPKELDDLLEKDAKTRGSTVNALVSSIMRKYAQWDRHTKMFPYVSIPSSLFRDLLEMTDEDELAMLAERRAVELTNQVMSLWFKKVTLEDNLKLFAIESEYSGQREVEIENEGRNYTISVYHDFGKKYSVFFVHFADKLMRTCFQIIPKFEFTENTVTYRFQAP